MAEETNIARMEAHIARVVAVGPKWEKAVNKLRKQFPDDTIAVYKRTKVMVNESKAKKDKESASTSVPRAYTSTSTSTSNSACASTSSKSKSSRKESKRPPAPPAPTSSTHFKKDAKDTTLTLPVKKKPLMDLSDEMTKDTALSLPELKATASTSSTIQSFTSGASGEERFPGRDDDHISLDGFDLAQSFELPPSLMSIFTTIDTLQGEVDEHEKNKEKEKDEERTQITNETPVSAMKEQVSNDTIVNKTAGDVNMAADAAARPSHVDPSGDAIMRPVEHKTSSTIIEPIMEMEAKDPSSGIKQVKDTIMQGPELQVSAPPVSQARDITMTPVEAGGSKANVIPPEASGNTTQTEDKNTSPEIAVDEAGDTTMLPVEAKDTDNKAGVASEPEAQAPVYSVPDTKNEQKVSKIPDARATPIKVEQTPNGATRPQYNHVTDILLSSLSIDRRIVAYLASVGLTSTSYLLLKGVREDDIRPIVDAVAKAEGVGIVDGVLAARRIEEAYHSFCQSVYAPSPKAWGTQ